MKTKTILVVDDRPENLAAAKSFLSAFAGQYEFVYATNRTDGLNLLPTVDAVITDMELPTTHNEQPVHRGKNAPTPENGFMIAMHAVDAKKPMVIITGHSGLVATITINPKYPDNPYWQAFGKETDIQKIVSYINTLVNHGGSDQFVREWIDRDIATSKTSERSWEIAWNKLLLQLRNAEMVH